MQINRTRVRNIDRYIHPSLNSQFVRVICPFEEISTTKLNRAGLKNPLVEGESYLPPIVGRATQFNADGRWNTHRDQPKEKRYVRTIYWRWKQYGGEEREDARDIYRSCFPRSLILPPAEELFGFPINGVVVAATEAVSLPYSPDRQRD